MARVIVTAAFALAFLAAGACSPDVRSGMSGARADPFRPECDPVPTSLLAGPSLAPRGSLFQELREEALLERDLNLEALRVLAPEQASPRFVKTDHNHIVVKFREGSAVRLRREGFVVEVGRERFDLTTRLSRQSLDLAQVNSDLDTFSALVTTRGVRVRRSAPFVDEGLLTTLRESAERNTGAEQPDLNLFFDVILDNKSEADAEALRERIAALPSVEVAYFQPIPENADIPPMTTLNLESSQGYLRASTKGGVDVDFARSRPGGRGQDVRIVDIEYGWTLDHEDFPDRSRILVERPCQDWDPAHGAAVLGVLWGVQNGYGVTGMTPDAAIGRVSPYFVDHGILDYNNANAMLYASEYLREGDIILLEQQIRSDAGPCPRDAVPSCDQWGMMPVETAPYDFAMIANLTGRGFIVVEAAGNGKQRIERNASRDSGAIMVGAIDPRTSEPSWFTNYGSRIDVNAWGSGIATLGYGEDPADTPTAAMRPGGRDRRQWYTTDFGGTSGASPIVTGAAALIQSNRRARGLPALKPSPMRALLVRTGARNANDPHAVGVMPNIRAAIEAP